MTSPAYAKAVHLSAPEFYAFAFDDAAGKDGTVRAFQPLNEPTTLTLGDMTGSPIPSKTDSTKIHAQSPRSLRLHGQVSRDQR
jgi:hypothetical protein